MSGHIVVPKEYCSFTVKQAWCPLLGVTRAFVSNECHPSFMEIGLEFENDASFIRI